MKTKSSLGTATISLTEYARLKEIENSIFDRNALQMEIDFLEKQKAELEKFKEEHDPETIAVRTVYMGSNVLDTIKYENASVVRDMVIEQRLQVFKNKFKCNIFGLITDAIQSHIILNSRRNKYNWKYYSELRHDIQNIVNDVIHDS